MHLEGPLIANLRGQFAEFLKDGSLERLRILSSPTCVSLRYGHAAFNLRQLFLGTLSSHFGILIWPRPFGTRTTNHGMTLEGASLTSSSDTVQEY